MRLRAYLVTSAVIATTLSLALAGISIAYRTNIQQRLSEADTGAELVRASMDFAILTNEYLNSHLPRVVRQWRSRQQTTMALIDDHHHPHQIQDIRSRLAYLTDAFERHESVYQQLQTDDLDADERQRLQEVGQRLANRMRLLYTDISIAAYQVASSSREAAADLARQYNNIIIVFAGLLTLLVGTATIVLARVITKNLKMLLSHANRLSERKFDQPVEDLGNHEFGILSHAFEQLRQRLLKADLQASEQHQRQEDMILECTRKLEASESKTRVILDNIAGAVISIDSQGLIRSFSSTAGQMFGYTLEEIYAQSFARLIFGLNGPEQVLSWLRERLADLDSRNQRVDCVRKNGEVFIAELSLAEVATMDETLIICLVRDVSRRAQLEGDLIESRNQAQRTDEARTAFLAGMSHEIRAPLNSVLGYSQLLALDKSLSHQQLESIGAINESGRHLLELINAVLDLSKIESGQVEVLHKNFDLHALLHDVDQMFRIPVEKKGLRFEINGFDRVPQNVVGDKGKLSQVLINVIDNAVALTQRGKVSVVVSAQDVEFNQLSLSFAVTDTGEGVTEQEIEGIFRPFGQALDGKKGDGTGLGLTISRHLCRLMGGDIRVHSKRKIGSTFTAEVRVGKSTGDIEETVTDAASNKVTSTDSSLVMIVDDSHGNRDLLRKLLVSKKFDVIEAIDGQNALQQCLRFRPRVILMDIRMPVMDGIETIATLRRLTRGEEIAILAMGSSVFAEDSKAALKAGADAFIGKPIDFRELLSVMSRWVHIE